MAESSRVRALFDGLDQLAAQLVLGDPEEAAKALASLDQFMTSEQQKRAHEELEALLRETASNEIDIEAFQAGLEALREASAGSTLAAESAAAFLPGKAAVVSSALNQDPELVADFVMESREHLSNVETGVLELEREPDKSEILHSVFRSFHTIKGLAGFLEFEGIQDLAHEVETILDLARTGGLRMTAGLIDLVLESADFVGGELNRIEGSLRGQCAFETRTNEVLLARVRAVSQQQKGNEACSTPVGPGRGLPGADFPGSELSGSDLPGSDLSGSDLSPARLEAPAEGAEARALEARPPELFPRQTSDDAESSVRSRAGTSAKVTAGATRTRANEEPQMEATSGSSRKKQSSQEVHAIRVDTAKLDYLLDMVGEMVIAESMVRLDPDLAASKNTRLQRNLNQLRRVTEEVQKVAMATRLQPVGTLFQRVNRLVRDTARKAGKLAEVELFGEDTQLDKTIIEELTDPIMHMVRNSIDHGIEPPQERLRAGKPETGRIQLKAYRQADHIQLEIVDDGRGLNQEKILKKARERGLIGEHIELADSEIFQLIFEPGFSTADQVTDISGRGVGMDVVKKQIQKLRGKIEIQSSPGKGTTFFLKLPLTLAIVEGLVVGVGRERYILPIYSVQEMFRPAASQFSTVQGRGEMVMVRNQLLPVIRLYRSLAVKPRITQPTEGLMIVAETEGRRFVLLVDEFIGKQEVVIKNLGESLKNTLGVAGGAILGDGRVGLILDLEAIYNDRSGRASEDGPPMPPLERESVVPV